VSSFPGERRRRTGLIAGLVLLAALAAGVLLGLVLVSTRGDQAGQSPPVPSPSPSPTPTSAPPPLPGAMGGSTALAAATSTGQAIADAITGGDAGKYALLTCEPQAASALAALQQKWAAAGRVKASMPRPPVLLGDTASVTIHVEGAAGSKDTVFPLREQARTWCIPG
jgi:hypothetical protein